MSWIIWSKKCLSTDPEAMTCDAAQGGTFHPSHDARFLTSTSFLDPETAVVQEHN
jgi:hypothetical protein